MQIQSGECSGPCRHEGVCCGLPCNCKRGPSELQVSSLEVSPSHIFSVSLLLCCSQDMVGHTENAHSSGGALHGRIWSWPFHLPKKLIQNTGGSWMASSNWYCHGHARRQELGQHEPHRSRLRSLSWTAFSSRKWIESPQVHVVGRPGAEGRAFLEWLSGGPKKRHQSCS